MALTGTCWLSMVRRRSTVRFRKGAPRSGAFFDTEPLTSLGGFQWKEQVSGSVGSLSPREAAGSGWSGTTARLGGGVRWGALWGQDRYQAALRGCVRRWSSPLPPRALPADWYGQGRAPGGRVAPRKDPAWVRENPRSLPLTCRPATAASNWSEGCEASADGRAGITRGAWRVTNGRWA